MSAFAWVSLRRLLRPWFLCATTLLVCWAAHAMGSTGDSGAAARALARAQTWGLFAALAPFFLHACAGLARPAEMRAWLAGGARRGALAGALVSAAGIGALLLCALVALASEAVLPGARVDCDVLLARPALPAGTLFQGDGPLRWRTPRPPGSSDARLALGLALGTSPGGAPVRWRVRDGEAERVLETTLARRGWLELELPPEASGVLEWELERLGSGAVVVLAPDALELVTRGGPEWRATLAFAAHAALALFLGATLTLALARFLPAALATALALALLLLACGRAWSAAGAWVAAFEELGLARIPPGPSLADLATTLLAALLGVLFLTVSSGWGGTTR